MKSTVPLHENQQKRVYKQWAGRGGGGEDIREEGFWSGDGGGGRGGGGGGGGIKGGVGL